MKKHGKIAKSVKGVDGFNSLDLDVFATGGHCKECVFHSFDCMAEDVLGIIGLWPENFYCAENDFGIIFKKKEQWETCTRDNIKVGDTVIYKRDANTNPAEFQVEYVAPKHLIFQSGSNVVVSCCGKLKAAFLENLKRKKK